MENKYNTNFISIENFFNGFNDYIKDINRINLNHNDYNKDATIIFYYEYCNLIYYNSKLPYTGNITLLVPSIFNSPSILFHDDKKLMKIINEHSCCYMIEWKQINNPQFSFDDYVSIIAFIIDTLYLRRNKTINVIGHCISGTLLLGASFLKQDFIKKIMLLTTPWDFSGFLPNVMWAKQYQIIEYIEKFEYVPNILFQIFFLFLSKESFHEKLMHYQNISDVNQKSFFLSIELWQSSGLNIPIGVFNQLVKDLALENKLVNNKWIIEGQNIDLKLLNKHVTMIFGAKDNMVPKHLFNKITDLISDVDVKILDCGHLGFLIGKSRHEFFTILQKWLTK